MVENRPWWITALQWTLWAVAMTAVMGWLARSRTAPRAPADARILVHPRSTLIIGVLCGGLFLTFAVLSAFLPGTSASPALSLFFLCFAFLGFVMILEYRNARHTLTSDGLSYGTLIGRTGTLRWADVRRLSYSESAKWFRMELADGRTVRVSAMLLGLQEFAQAALAQVPPAAVDVKTRTVLQATAAGDLPRVWG